MTKKIKPLPRSVLVLVFETIVRSLRVSLVVTGVTRHSVRFKLKVSRKVSRKTSIGSSQILSLSVPFK